MTQVNVVASPIEHLETDEDDSTVIVRLNRPGSRNALNLELARGLRDLLADLHDDPPEETLADRDRADNDGWD